MTLLKKKKRERDRDLKLEVLVVMILLKQMMLKLIGECREGREV